MKQLVFENFFVKPSSSLHQKEQMMKLNRVIKEKRAINYIKANTIANKAVSIKFGYSKALNKKQMNYEMLEEREKILEQVIITMVAKELGVNIPHVSELIYSSV